VHHAVCNVIEPFFESRFISDSYANRIGKGTHRAVTRLQTFAKEYRYALRLDIVKYFPAVDHRILLHSLGKVIVDDDTLALIATILSSSEGTLDQEYQPPLFPGDDLLDLCRPRGLPIGNLASQFWANCYLHPIDLFIKRQLAWPAYVRYVDDFALFGNSKRALWAAKQAAVERLAQLKLTIHEHNAQVMPVRCGVPWLGFVVYPNHRRVKARKVVVATRRLSDQYQAWQRGEIRFVQFDASVQGWINHVRYADSRGLRQYVLDRFDLSGRPLI
jgi:RNA-directed DNA polymerase